MDKCSFPSKTLGLIPTAPEEPSLIPATPCAAWEGVCSHGPKLCQEVNLLSNTASRSTELRPSNLMVRTQPPRPFFRSAGSLPVSTDSFSQIPSVRVTQGTFPPVRVQKRHWFHPCGSPRKMLAELILQATPLARVCFGCSATRKGWIPST